MERWSYTSVVGMLLYLASNSRQILHLRCINAPDLRIAQSVHMKKKNSEVDYAILTGNKREGLTN